MSLFEMDFHTCYFITIILFIITNGSAENEELELVSDRSTPVVSDQTLGTTFKLPDQRWIAEVLKDIAYYLRNHKFQEWDRRYYNTKTKAKFIGFFKAFPSPSLSSLHWKVNENCYSDFYKCITYLKSITENAPLTRKDDTTTMLNEKINPVNETAIKISEKTCKETLKISDENGLPFDDPLERFQWRTSASYFMCWYTMLGEPALSMLGESCDNFANCLDEEYGKHNYDPRADDRRSFACAIYSFCPDPCCPLKHIKSLKECTKNENNPCFGDDIGTDFINKVCKFERKDNIDFYNMIENKWNVTCNCKDKGYHWQSNFGICVDINECLLEKDDCDKETEDCINLPGSFQCVCKWDYVFDKNLKRCQQVKLFEEKTTENATESYCLMDRIKNFFCVIFHIASHG